VALLANNSGINSVLKGLPRSPGATYLFSGLAPPVSLPGVESFSGRFRRLSQPAVSGVPGDHRAVVYCVPDFLAVRGLCVITLVGAAPLLDAAYMEYGHPQRCSW